MTKIRPNKNDSEKKSTFKLGDDFIKIYKNSWQDSKTVLELWQKNGLFPTDEILMELIETAFWATLEKEESRFVSFTISYGKPREEESVYNHFFSEEIDFDVENLAKLSLAANSRRKIGVFLNSQSKLKIWGFGAKTLSDKEVRITSFGMGKLVATLAEKSSILITGKKFELLKRAITLIKTKLHDGIENHNSWVKSKDWDINTIQLIAIRSLDSIKFMTEKIRESGHGGTFLIIPETDKWKDAFEEIKYLSEGKWNLANHTISEVAGLFNKLIRIDSDERAGKHMAVEYLELIMDEHFSKMKEAGLAHNHALEDVAALANIDGAVVLGYDLSVLAFGAKIKSISGAVKAKDLLQKYPYLEDDEVTTATLPPWGTRHYSALNFVNYNKESLAFVVSEDGFITAFAFDKERNKILAYRHLEYFVDVIF
jgi:hypothetical protein